MPKESYADPYVAASFMAIPNMLISLPPAFNPSSPGHPNPLRQIDVLGLPDFFDHAGNCVNGTWAAMVILAAGVGIERLVPAQKRHPVVIATAAAGVAVGVNVAYEAGVYIPPIWKKEAGLPFDAPDAAYGGVSGVMCALTFCAVALRQKKRRSRENGKG